MKYLLIIPDGMGDKPLKSLGGRTPLEAAKTPQMDMLAKSARVGLTYNVPKGFVPGTDIGCMSVFGYDPKKYFTGRGPLEAAELGIRLSGDELAFRCNLVTTEHGRMKDFCADHISTREAAELLRDLDEEIRKTHGERFRFYPGKGTGYRNLMVASGEPKRLLSVRAKAPHDIMGKSFARYLPQDGSQAKVLREIMHRSEMLFAPHPVNRARVKNGKLPATMVWLWGQGGPPNLPLYYQKYGLRGGVISAVDLVKGIALYAGLDVIRVPGVTGFFDTNYIGKAEYALNTLRSRDFVAVHVESTDEASHMGDPKLKVQAIEDVDRLIVGTLRKGLEEFGEYRIMILPDHCTLVGSRTHSHDAVPFLIYDSKHPRKGPNKFSEKAAKAGGDVVKEGHKLLGMLLTDR